MDVGVHVCISRCMTDHSCNLFDTYIINMIHIDNCIVDHCEMYSLNIRILL